MGTIWKSLTTSPNSLTRAQTPTSSQSLPSPSSHPEPSQCQPRDSQVISAPSDEAAVSQQSSSALRNAKRTYNYLFNPPAGPSHLSRSRTPVLLRSLCYLCTFIFWRVVRYAKFVAVGAVAAAIGATAFGSVVTK